MVGHENRPEKADADRRRFLELAAKLGIAAPPVVMVALANPKYAAASGFTPPGGSSSGGSSSGSSSGGSSSGGSSSGSSTLRVFPSRDGRASDGDHRR
jgi:hypothetical protein